MGQVNIVNRGGAYFREYAIEPHDVLIRICLRYGHRDWENVYQLDENKAFRDRFPDPNQIDYVNPVNLFIPLSGATTTGVSVRGAPIGDYLIAQVYDETADPLVGVTLRLLAPGQPHEGRDITTSADGDIIIANPAAGDWFLASAQYELMPMAMAEADYPVQDMTTLPIVDSLPEPTTDFPLTRNGIDALVARPVFYIICPMCGVTFKTVKKSASGSDNICPNDGFNLTTIEATITANESSFSSPITGQNVRAVTGLVCRGTASQNTVHGGVTVYWDESRFLDPNGDNYTLWGLQSPAPAVPQTVIIIGRRTWGATPPETIKDDGCGKPRVYEFHATPQGSTTGYPYAYMGINSNETNPLSSVLKWMTVHHTADPAQYSIQTVIYLQKEQRDLKGVDGCYTADIAYHFVIDANGAIYEGRPLGIKGSHVPLFNGGNVGIVLAGDFQSRLANDYQPDIPTSQALDALDNLVDVLAARFKITSVFSHRQRKMQAVNDTTDCPGDNLIPHVDGIQGVGGLRQRYPGPPS